MSVAERLKLIAEENDLSLRKLSLSIGKTPGYLSASINKGTEVGSDALSQILINYPEYNIIWVLTGEGEKLKKDVKELHLLNEQETDYKKEATDPLLNIKALVEILKKELSPELKQITANQNDILRLANNQGTILMKVEEAAAKVSIKKLS